MAGMKKYKLAKESRRQAQLRPAALYHWHTAVRRELLRCAETDVPVLAEVLECEDEHFAGYVARVAGVDRIVIRRATRAVGLDLFAGESAVARLGTDISDDRVMPALLDRVAAGSTALAIELCLGSTGEVVELGTLPVTIEDVSDVEFQGPVEERGEGDFLVATVNHHDGSVYHHRFRSLEEATHQFERNVTRNEAFVPPLVA